MLTYNEFNYAQEGIISGIKEWWKKGVDAKRDRLLTEKALASAGGIGALGGVAFTLMVAKGIPAFKKVYKAVKNKTMTAKEAKEELEKEGWLYRNGKWVAVGGGSLALAGGGVYLSKGDKK